MTWAKRQRLDRALVERGLAETRARARQLIEAGSVRVNGEPATKPGLRVSEWDAVTVTAGLPYVSRGGQKLAAALTEFQLSVQGVVALDVGASTGGFTDCLLQHGAKRVYTVDVGREQLAESLRRDPRVRVFEQTDVRSLERLPEAVDLAVIDVSFISLRLILPAVERFLKSGGPIVALVKPQFEAGPGATNKRGVVTDPEVRQQVVANLGRWVSERGWVARGSIPSPIVGGEGNVEYLILIEPGRSQSALCEAL